MTSSWFLVPQLESNSRFPQLFFFSNASKTLQPVRFGIMHRVRRNWSTGPTLEMFGKGKGRISPVLSYASYYEVNGDSGGVKR